MAAFVIGAALAACVLVVLQAVRIRRWWRATRDVDMQRAHQAATLDWLKRWK